MSVWTEQGSWVAPPHWAVWAPPGIEHRIELSGAVSMRTLYLRPDLSRWASRSSVIVVSPLLRELILRAMELGFLDEREPLHRSVTDLILAELRSSPAPSLDLPLPASEPLRSLAAHLARCPGEKAGHPALARRFGVGVRSMERSFMAETGWPLGRWRRQARFLHAMRVLGDGATVKQASQEAGYQSPSAFIAAFRGAFGTTPSRYFAG